MKIFSLVVLYEQRIEVSETVKSILSNENTICGLFDQFELLIYDNSGNPQELNISTEIPITYFSDVSNSGLSSAYNFVFEKARSEFDWILLLDQDTELTNSFFWDLKKAMSHCSQLDDAVSIVPKMYYDGNLFSPAIVRCGGTHKPVHSKYTGIFLNGEIMAVGSGISLKTSFIETIGGFTGLFRLDCLDRWIFHKIFKLQKKCYILPTQLKHQLSILNFKKYMNPQKYRNQINAEGLFMLKYKSFLENILFAIRLLWRAIYLVPRTQSFLYSRHSVLLIYLLIKSKFNPSNYIEILEMEKK